MIEKVEIITDGVDVLTPDGYLELGSATVAGDGGVLVTVPMFVKSPSDMGILELLMPLEARSTDRGDIISYIPVDWFVEYNHISLMECLLSEDESQLERWQQLYGGNNE